MYGVSFRDDDPAAGPLVLYERDRALQPRTSRTARRHPQKLHFYGLGVIDKQDMRYIAFSAAIWLCWLIYSFLYFWAGYYFMTVNGYTLGQWSMVLLATLLMAMIGGVTAGSIMDRIGRKPAFVVGCVGLSLILLVLGFGQGWMLPLAAIITGFFTSFTYTWIVVYVPEVFPTERRGACMGWTTTVARVSYVVGPALAAVLLKAFPTMEWFWVVAAVVVLVPIAIVYAFNPYETKTKELEEIEHLAVDETISQWIERMLTDLDGSVISVQSVDSVTAIPVRQLRRHRSACARHPSAVIGDVTMGWHTPRAASAPLSPGWNPPQR